MNKLHEKFNRLMPSVTLTEFMNMPKINCIIRELETRFGRGRSPFKIHGVIIADNVAHIYVEGRKYGSSKWIKNLRSTFNVDLLVFYITKVSFIKEIFKVRDVFTEDFLDALEKEEGYGKYRGIHPQTFCESIVNITPHGTFSKGASDAL